MYPSVIAVLQQDHPRYAAEHQLAVIDCLEDPDETLKRRTLDLLYSMVNPVNVEFITEKLLRSVVSDCCSTRVIAIQMRL